MLKRYLPAVLLLMFAACNNPDGPVVMPVTDTGAKPPQVAAPLKLKTLVMNQIPHDTSSFTEGLQIFNGKLYEGAGDYANSAIQVADLKTGKVLQQHKMGSASIFGEGINFFKGKIYQLTWQNHIVFVYDGNNIEKPIKTDTWGYEGWGMTNDGNHLIISDGKADGHLYYVNPDSGFTKIVKVLTVRDNTGPVDQLNELEYIEGFIYANVWNMDKIVKIDPATGNVVAEIDASALMQQYAPEVYNSPNFSKEANVLNGIAYDAATKKIYITGKRWPKLFEVKFK